MDTPLEVNGGVFKGHVWFLQTSQAYGYFCLHFIDAQNRVM